MFDKQWQKNYAQTVVINFYLRSQSQHYALYLFIYIFSKFQVISITMCVFIAVCAYFLSQFFKVKSSWTVLD